MNLQIWQYDGFDIAASSDNYNYMCFKEDMEYFIHKVPVKIGIYEFIPGEIYKKFGSTKLGYSWYDGEPLQFKGHFNNYLLFSKPNQTIEGESGYLSIYFAWYYHQELTILISVNESGDGQVIKMN